MDRPLSAHTDRHSPGYYTKYYKRPDVKKRHATREKERYNLHGRKGRVSFKPKERDIVLTQFMDIGQNTPFTSEKMLIETLDGDRKWFAFYKRLERLKEGGITDDELRKQIDSFEEREWAEENERAGFDVRKKLKEIDAEFNMKYPKGSQARKDFENSPIMRRIAKSMINIQEWKDAWDRGDRRPINERLHLVKSD